MKNKGFTFVELICVTILMAIVAAVLYPAFLTAKIGGKSEAAKVNLHKFWNGLMLYQSNYDEKVPYGSPQDMGLPADGANYVAFLNDLTGDNHNTWDTKSEYLPCGKRVDDEEFEGLGYMPFVKSDWENAVQRLKGKTVLMYDKNCNAPKTRVLCQFCDKRSIGITLNGSIRDRTSRDWHVYDQHFYE